MSADAFSGTLHKLYAAAADFSLWTEALSDIEQLTESAGVTVTLVPRASGDAGLSLTGMRLASHFGLEDIVEYDRDYMPICKRVAAAKAWPDLPMFYDAMILSEAEMDRDPVYSWLGKHGLRYFVGSALCNTDHYHLMWSFQRTPAQEHVQKHEIELFRLLKPHLAQALGLADRLGALAADQRFSSTVLEALPQAIFALSATGRILFASLTGERLLLDGDGLTGCGGVLTARHSAEQCLLESMIRQAAAPSAKSAGGWMRLSRASGRLPYAAFIAPLVTGADELLSVQAKVLVTVHDPALRRLPSPEGLKQLYKLTETEVRVAAAMAAGHSAGSAAANLGIGVETVRTHLKSIFRKMKVGRQQDLVRLLASLTADSLSNGDDGRS